MIRHSFQTSNIRPFLENRLEIKLEKDRIEGVIRHLNTYFLMWDIEKKDFDLELYIDRRTELNLKNDIGNEEFATLSNMFDTVAINHPFVVISKQSRYNRDNYKWMIIGANNEKYITYRDIITSVYDYNHCSFQGKDEYGRLIIRFEFR